MSARRPARPTAPRPPPLEIVLASRLTRASLDAALEPVTKALRSSQETFELIVDARAMTDYDGDARARFVEWNATFRRQLRAVAILTSKTVWHMVISAMSLASGQVMKAFGEKQAAMEWFVETRQRDERA